MTFFPGKLLTVDLTREQVTWSELSERAMRQVLGGRELNAWWLASIRWDQRTTSSLAAACSQARPPRLHLACTSARVAGVQVLLIRGRARRPVMLWIDGDRAEIVDAAHL